MKAVAEGSSKCDDRLCSRVELVFEDVPFGVWVVYRA